MIALKAAWEIGPEELRMVDRLDSESPGVRRHVSCGVACRRVLTNFSLGWMSWPMVACWQAFAEVWHAKWDRADVAVKILRWSHIVDALSVNDFANVGALKPG